MDTRREGPTVVAVAVGVRTRAAVVAVAVGVRTRTARAMSHHMDRSGQSQTSGKQWTLDLPQLANDVVGDLRVAETSSWDLLVGPSRGGDRPVRVWCVDQRVLIP